MLTVEKPKMLHTNLDINAEGHLTLAGVDTVAMAKKYGTPLYLFDEERIRSNCRTYIRAMKKYFGGASRPLLASKALSFKGIYRIAAEEGMHTDIVSPGELYTARAAGFPMENAYFHGNNKTDADIELAIESGIGYFIVDNREELDAVNACAKAHGTVQRILLRLTPGIDPHTHSAIATGKVDSKFGTSIETGQAEELITYALSLDGVRLLGFHCHIGSQIFDIKPFTDTADIMLRYIAFLRDKYGYVTEILNLGGGFGVRYLEEHPVIDYEKNIKEISEHVKARCAEFSLKMPDILMEPGRSIVADAGLTLYTVGSVKTITGYKSYVSVDGGMPDNPRYALYQSPYTVKLASRMLECEDFTCTIAGRCCESGDIIQENVNIARPERGDILAVLVTGAYNYSMASNYNRIPRPPLVLIDKDGRDRVGVRRETYADLCALDE
jgi:diaminopimelate decarboxylase